MLSAEEIEQAIREKFADDIEEASYIFGVYTIRVFPKSLPTICRFLKETEGLAFDYLMSLTAVDWIETFELVYHLYSIPHKHYVTIKVRVEKDDPTVPSVATLWRAADWQEREVYDMFGVKFDGHSNLRRILLDDDWEGFPLRKDFQEEEMVANSND